MAGPTTILGSGKAAQPGPDLLLASARHDETRRQDRPVAEKSAEPPLLDKRCDGKEKKKQKEKQKTAFWDCNVA